MITAEEEEWEGPRHRAALATWTYVHDMPVGVTLSRVKAMPAWEKGREGEGETDRPHKVCLSGQQLAAIVW